MTEYLPDGYDYKFIENGRKLAFRIRDISNRESALAWLSAYENKSKFTWKISKTYPKAGKIHVFHENYRCQLNTDNHNCHQFETKSISKHIGCAATLEIKVKRFLEKSRSKYLDVDAKEYPCTVILKNKHNHSQFSAEVLSEATKNKLLWYFEQGFSAYRAHQALETELLFKEKNFHIAKSDTSLLPSVSVIHHLFNNEFSASYVPKTTEEFLNYFIANKCEVTGTKACFKKFDDNIVIALCTPIMQRAHQLLTQANEFMLEKASNNTGKNDWTIYFFVTPCVASGVPLGCIIMNNEEESMFRKGVELLITCLPEDSKLVTVGPSTIMTDGDLKERNVLGEIWSDSKFLLCHFQVLKNVWTWLYDKSNRVSKDSRKEIYFLFNKMLKSKTLCELEEEWEEMESSDAFWASAKVKDYFSDLWNRKILWACCYRIELPITENNIKYYIEALFRVLRECILKRMKSLNVVQLTDFIITNYENYLKNRLLDFTLNHFSKNLLKNFCSELHLESSLSENISYNNECDVYTVLWENGETYRVDLTGLFCTCPVRSTGKLCKEIFAVIKKLSAEVTAYVNSYDNRVLIYNIAMGENPENEELLQDLSFNPLTLENSRERIPITDLYPASQEIAIKETCSEIANSDVSENYSEVENSDAEKTDSEIANSDVRKNYSEVENSDAEKTDSEIANSDIEEIKQNLTTFHRNLILSIENNPKAFIPAIKKMMENTQKFVKSENEMLSALYNFGKPMKHLQSKVCIKQKKSDVQIPVQPTTNGKRKFTLIDKGNQLKRRP